MELSGLVIKEVIGKGSKSEHDAVLLDAKEGKYALRLKGGNPFRDPKLDRLVGKRIRANGVLTGSTFVITDFVETGDA